MPIPVGSCPALRALDERFSPKLHVLASLPVGQAVALLNTHDKVVLVPYACEVVLTKANPLGPSRPHVTVAHVEDAVRTVVTRVSPTPSPSGTWTSTARFPSTKSRTGFGNGHLARG